MFTCFWKALGLSFHHRNDTLHDPKLTREQLMAINKQHVEHAKLLFAHLLDSQNQIAKLQAELVQAEKKIQNLESTQFKRQTLLVADSHLRSINHKLVEQELGGQLFFGKAYNSGEWPRSKFPQKSQQKVVPVLIKQRPYSDLILQLSCNDITNLDHITDSELRYHMARKSTKQTVDIAVKALKNNTNLRNVLILPRSPRSDSVLLA